MRSSRATLLSALIPLALFAGAGPAAAAPVDGFEGGLPAGIDGSNGILIGFSTFQGSGAVAIGTTSTPPAPVPGAAPGNRVLKLDVDTDSFAGFVHVFENAAVDRLAPRDWSSYDTLTFWLYGHDSGAEMYIDVLDNREPGSTGYPFELWTSTFVDDFSGWKVMSIAFADLTRKEIGNGAPNDGLGLTTAHGWALGTLATGGPRTYYVDDVRVVSTIPEPGTVALAGAGLLFVMRAVRRRRP